MSIARSSARLVAETAVARLAANTDLAEVFGDRLYYGAARALIDGSAPIETDAVYTLVDRSSTVPSGSSREGRSTVELGFVVVWQVRDRVGRDPSDVLYWLDLSEAIFKELQQDQGCLQADLGSGLVDITTGILAEERAQSPLPVPGHEGLLMAELGVAFKTHIHLETREIA